MNKPSKKQLKISRFTQLLNNLAGSVKKADRFRGLTTEEIIKKAKQEHFQS